MMQVNSSFCDFDFHSDTYVLNQNNKCRRSINRNWQLYCYRSSSC